MFPIRKDARPVNQVGAPSVPANFALLDKILQYATQLKRELWIIAPLVQLVNINIVGLQPAP